MGVVMVKKKTMKHAITTLSIGIAAMTVTLAAVPNIAQASGTLSTIQHGRYQCSLPGDASGPSRIVVKDADFRIASASSYRSPEGRGTYMVRGKLLTFTRGPKNGEKYQLVGATALQKQNRDGTLSRLMCARVGAKL